MAPPKIPAEERFAAKYRVDEKTGCWIWTAALMPNGYAQFRHRTGKNGYGHRFAYEHFIGPIPDGRQLHHICENRACVNPEHLRPTTPRENLMASDTPARRNSQRTHCKRGHPLTDENVEFYAGRRRCRTCAQLWRAEHREELLAYNRRHYQANREERRAYQRLYYERSKQT